MANGNGSIRINPKLIGALTGAILTIAGYIANQKVQDRRLDGHDIDLQEARSERQEFRQAIHRMDTRQEVMINKLEWIKESMEKDNN